MAILQVNTLNRTVNQVTIDNCSPPEPGNFYWFHSDDHNEAEENLFFSKIGQSIDSLALSDARRRRHPPKFEHFDDYKVLLVREIDADDINEAFRPNHLSLIYGPGFIFTRCTLDSRAIDQCREELSAWSQNLGTTDHVACRIVRLLSDSCSAILAASEDLIEEIEDRIMVKGTEADLNLLLSLGNNMKKLGRSLAYQTAAVEELFHLEEEHLQHIYQDIYENTERNASRAGLYQSIISDLINGYISINSHHLNRIMKTLTIATVIFLPLSLLAGIYGMNFSYIPELAWRPGYFVVLGFMLLLSSVLLAIFRKVKWL